MFSAGYSEPVLPMVSVWGPWTFYHPADALSASVPSSATWELAARAVYVPVQVPTVCVARRVWWANGATVSGGATIEVGIYADAGYKPGTKLASKSATQGTLNEVQFATLDTAVTLSPGLWWLALMMSSATNTTGFRVLLSTIALGVPRMFQQATANPLPSSATPVVRSAGNVWLCGFSTTTIA